MSNPHREALINQVREAAREARLEACAAGLVYQRPIAPNSATLIDWISDNPAFKQSKAIQQLLDSYFESLD